MSLSALDRWLWALTFFANVALFLVLAGRRYVRRFPVFALLIFGSIVRTVVLFALFRRGTPAQYSSTYWWFAICDTTLELLVVYELASHVFRPLGDWARDARGRAILLFICSLLFAAALTQFAAPTVTTWQQLFVVKGSFFFAVLMSELFVSMLALSVTVGLPWRTPVARIAQGFGAYALLDLWIEAGHVFFGTGYTALVDTVLTHVRIGAYLLCLVFWIGALLAKAHRPQALSGERLQYLEILEKAASEKNAFLRRRRK